MIIKSFRPKFGLVLDQSEKTTLLERNLKENSELENSRNHHKLEGEHKERWGITGTKFSESHNDFSAT